MLAIDTTHERGSIALVNTSGVIEEVALHSPDGFAHVIFGEIEALLARYRLTFEDIDVYACASGPGTFTGVRVGLTVVKGLAEATGRRVVTISNLMALASLGSAERRAVVIDARRGEIYGAVYDASHFAANSQSFTTVCDEVVAPIEQWLRSLPDGDLEFIGNDSELEWIKSAASQRTGQITLTQAPAELAGAIGRIAIEQFRRGMARTPEEIDANYVRRSDAELLWKEPFVESSPR